MPRSNVIRVLNDLLQKEFVITKDMIKDGRAQKLYSLTDKGQEKLRQMKTQWASFFTNMADQSPIEKLANPFTIPEVRDTFLEELALCQTKEEMLLIYYVENNQNLIIYVRISKNALKP